MDTVIACENIRHTYGEKLVLDGLSLQIKRGGIHGILGKNGAGKTTTINILMGFLEPLSGHCQVLGDPSHAIRPPTRQRIALLHESFVQYDFMSIAELAKYYARFYPRWDDAIFRNLVDRLGVPCTRRISRLSCGQRSQVCLGLIMAQHPELMILDDYSMGLDAGYHRLFLDFLQEYVREHGTTVLLTSHIVQDLERLMDSMIVIQSGKVLLSSTRDVFFKNFRQYTFDRGAPAATDALRAGGPIATLERMKNTLSLCTFDTEQTLRAHLAAQGIAAPANWREVPMTFEDAFLNLTGKY